MTLQSLLGAQFLQHHGALKSGYAPKVDALVQYLLSIDEGTPTIPISQAGAEGGDFCAAP